METPKTDAGKVMEIHKAYKLIKRSEDEFNNNLKYFMEIIRKFKKLDKDLNKTRSAR